MVKKIKISDKEFNKRFIKFVIFLVIITTLLCYLEIKRGLRETFLGHLLVVIYVVTLFLSGVGWLTMEYKYVD